MEQKKEITAAPVPLVGVNMDRIRPVEHHNIFCDECGTSPLVGTRYKSRILFDYDICTSCMEEYEGNPTDYVGLDVPLSTAAANRYGPKEDSSLFVKGLSPNVVTSQLVARDRVISACLSLLPGSPSEDYEALGQAIATHSTLKMLHIHFCWLSRDIPPEAVMSIARGVGNSTSVEHVRWCLPQEIRANLTCEMKRVLRNMVAESQSLTHLFIQKPCSSPKSKQSAEPDSGENAFVGCILDGLKENNSMRKLRLECFGALNDQNKNLLLDIVRKKRGALKHVFAPFGNDYRLKLLLACGRNAWMERLTDTNNTKEKRLRVLEEALKLTPVGKVPTMYYLLRNSPDIIN